MNRFFSLVSMVLMVVMLSTTVLKGYDEQRSGLSEKPPSYELKGIEHDFRG